MRTKILDVTCVAVLCVLLSLGLWPFHSPKNGVTWLEDHNGLRFGNSSTVISSSAFQMTDAPSGAAVSVEAWLQPRRIWDSSTLLTFCTPGNPLQFSMRQSDASLDLRTEIQASPHSTNTSNLFIRNAVRRSGPVFFTISSGIQGTAVYIDGVLARTSPKFRLSAKELTGRLVLGDSTGQPDSWAGQLLGLAIYRRELTAKQVLRHYETWTQREQPDTSEDECNIALYLFDERAGNVVHNQVVSGADLNIPEKYVVLDKKFLEPFWKEFSMSRSYWSGNFKNIVGFVPFGFFFYACLSAHHVRRAVFATLILGTLTSLTIEILQAFLPTRDSGTTDLLTNTLGTYIGVAAHRAISPILAARFPWLPFVASTHG